MQIVLEQIEREKRDAGDLVVSFFSDILKKKNKNLRSQKDVRCCKSQQSFETHDPHK